MTSRAPAIATVTAIDGRKRLFYREDPVPAPRQSEGCCMVVGVAVVQTAQVIAHSTATVP
jgi:hypothetical protein